LSEFFPAAGLCAGERLLAGMDEFMFPQILLADELLLTIVTLEVPYFEV
jgi:hypothetical protein